MNMKKAFLRAALLSLTMAAAAGAQDPAPFKPYAVSPRVVKIGNTPQITLCRDGKATFEIVKPADPAVDNAVNELKTRLFEITGAKAQIVAKASGKVPAFYLGRCPEAEKLGLKPEKLDRDGFFIKTDGNRIFITGCDGGKGTKLQRATLYGVFDFLERFAGVRYYFPGEIGTIVPKKRDWALPAIDIAERPDTQRRIIYCYPCARPPLDVSKYYYPGLTARTRIPLTWRNSTRRTLGANHGLNALQLPQRFSKTHPEYFALTKDGKRFDHTYSRTVPSHVYGHLCFSSEGLKNEVYLDAVAALTGQPASSRGITRWNHQWDPEGVSICPNDGIYWCQCEKCRDIPKKGAQAVNDHIWKFRVDIANRLKQNKIPGYVTANSYAQFSLMPSMELPDNINASITQPGPWSMNVPSIREREDRRMREWVKRVKHKVTIGTYATKALALVAEVPNVTPRAVGAFLKSRKDSIYGCFFEVGSDHWMFDCLNCYVFAKVMWNMETDVEALLDEHCRLMYGPAAPQMNGFYRELEDIWMNKIMRRTDSTSVGEKWQIPSVHEIWTKIYSPEKVAEIGKLLDQAEKAAAADPEALKRVKFIRQEIWGPVVGAAKDFQSDTFDRSAWTLRAADAAGIVLDGDLDEPAWKKAEPVWLNVNPFKRNAASAKVEVQTRVRMLQDGEFFYFGLEADEPETAAMRASPGRKDDDSEIWMDNCAEIFLAPDLSSRLIYQFIFDSNGVKCDLKNSLHKADPKYDTNFEVKTKIIPGKMWTAEVRIPRKAMPELTGKNKIVGNFTRRRVLTGKKVGTVSYVWYPKLKNTPEYCGFIQLEKKAGPANLIQCGDFDQAPGKHRIGAWNVGKTVLPEKGIFMTKGSSLRLEGETRYASQPIPIQPGHRYRISFYVKSEDMKPGLRASIRFGGSGIKNLSLFERPTNMLVGTHKWRRMVLTFRAPPKFGTEHKPHIAFFLFTKNSGRCWIDHVELVELVK